MSEDIGRILQKWPYDPQSSIRKVIDTQGTEKIQVRVDQGAFQGILQMEVDGRPDGRKPHDWDFVLDYHRDSLERHVRDEGEESDFALDHEACEELFDEGRRIYERYVFLLQIQDYARVIRDTQRNMDLFRFVHRYGELEDDRMNLEKWWPYVIRIHAVARVMFASQNDDFDSAMDIIKEALEEIGNLEEVEAEEFYIERKRSRKALKELQEELAKKRPVSALEQLERQLAEAIEKEEFEKAAELRDRILELEVRAEAAEKGKSP